MILKTIFRHCIYLKSSDRKKFIYRRKALSPGFRESCTWRHHLRPRDKTEQNPGGPAVQAAHSQGGAALPPSRPLLSELLAPAGPGLSAQGLSICAGPCSAQTLVTRSPLL